VALDLSWLPDLVESSDFEDYGVYLDHLDAVFVADFVRYRPRFRGMPVNADTAVKDGRMGGFWHICSEDSKDPSVSRDENFRPHRACHIAWPRKILDNAHDPTRVTCFADGEENKRGTTWYLALLDLSYVVVLKHRGNQFYLATAYPTDEWTRRSGKLRKIHDSYWARKGKGRSPL
jgi:hypothetical protein